MSHVVHAPHQTPVQHIHSSIHYLALESSRNALSLKRAPGSNHHHAIPMLDNTDLL
jgi:hypothetical protein